MLSSEGNGALDKGGDSYPVWIARVVIFFVGVVYIVTAIIQMVRVCVNGS